MALTPRNIVCDGVDAFSSVIAIGIDPLTSGAEGSPIYLTLDAEVDVDGSYSDGGYDYSFNGTTSISQQDRMEIRDHIGGVDPALENYEVTRDHDVSTWIDGAAITGIPEGEFAAVQSRVLGCNGGSPPFAPPSFDGAILEDTITGTKTLIASPYTEVDRDIALTVTPPYFTGSIQDGDLLLVVGLRVEVNSGEADQYIENFTDETDVSAWGATDFRDIRGTYGTTSTDANGIEYIWSVTVG